MLAQTALMSAGCYLWSNCIRFSPFGYSYIKFFALQAFFQSLLCFSEMNTSRVGTRCVQIIMVVLVHKLAMDACVQSGLLLVWWFDLDVLSSNF